MKTKFMSAAVALAAALTLILGVAFPGALPSLQMPTAQAQTTTIPVTPEKRDFTNTTTQNTYSFTVGADATMNSFDFTITGNYFLLEYTLRHNGQKLSSETFQSSQKLPFSKTISGLNAPLKKGDKIDLDLRFNYPKVQGSVSVALRGTTSTTPDPDPGDPNPPVTTVTPAAPTAVDPATAPTCVEKGYINIPDTKGVDYFIGSERKPAGQHFYEGKKATVKVTAKPQNGYQFAAGAKTEWPFDFSGEVKTCSDDQPTLPDDGTRAFKATGHGFSLQGDPVDPKKPNSFTAKVGEDAKLNYITVRIKTDATVLDPQHYQLTVDKIEDGVTLQKRNVNIGNGYITMDVVPVKAGKQVDSAFLPKDAVFTFTNNLAENKSLVVELDAYGIEASSPTDPPVISEPDRAKWLEPRVKNPQLPQRCGLRVALVVDLSTSLNFADPNGFTASKQAATAFVDAFKGTPTELGIYNFATTAGVNSAGTTRKQNPPYVSMQTQAGVDTAKNVISNWSYTPGNGSTNWEAGLNQVKGQNYDVVYFITDGMPTTSSETLKNRVGEFVQASAVNDAIKAANELKNQGTRVVPLMVDLELGGYTGERWTVEKDYVLKDLTRVQLEEAIPQEKGTFFRINSGIQEANRANYIGTTDSSNPANGAFTLVNLDAAMAAVKKTDKHQPIEVYEKANATAAPKRITFDQSKWTYGTRTVKQMGEDISGDGDTVRIEGYRQLADRMKSIAQGLSEKCNGEVIVKKRIVDENGNVLSDGEPGWEFTLSANGQKVIDPGNGELVRQWRKVTSWRDEDKGTARWNIQSEEKQKLTLVETQQQGYSLYQRDSKNAVCEETRDGKTTMIPVENVGEFGFTVNMREKDKKLSRVSCVVENYKAPETAPGKLTFKKAQYVDGKIQELAGLGGATFEIYPSKEGKPDYSAGKPIYTIKPGQESIEVKTTGTFFLVETKAPQGLNLLPQPVPFEISIDQTTKKYKISTVGSNNGQIQASGLGTLMVLTVADTRSGELPKTGGYGVGLVGLIGAALAGAGLILGRRKLA